MLTAMVIVRRSDGKDARRTIANTIANKKSDCIKMM